MELVTSHGNASVRVAGLASFVTKVGHSKGNKVGKSSLTTRQGQKLFGGHSMNINSSSFRMTTSRHFPSASGWMIKYYGEIYANLHLACPCLPDWSALWSANIMLILPFEFTVLNNVPSPILTTALWSRLGLKTVIGWESYSELHS